MVKGRLIAGVLLWTGLVVAVSFAPGIDGSRFSERCAGSSLRTLTAAEAEFRSRETDGFWTASVAAFDETGEPEVVYSSPSVAGLYRTTSTSVLMAGTDHAIRVIEFSPASADEDEGWTPEPPGFRSKLD